MSKYCYDLNYFKEINTEEKAYWLGFIYADGCITSDSKHQLIIELSAKDKCILEKFIKSICGNIKIRENKHGVRISVCQKEFTKNLLTKGVIPQKSLKLEFPSSEIVPEYLVKHFIRGYFDGDGSITYNRYFDKTRNKSYGISEFSVLGTNNFIDCVSKIIPSSKHKIKHETRNTNVYKYRIYNRPDIIMVFHYLYDDASIYLGRKYDIFKSIIEIENKYLEKYTRKVG